MATTIQDVILAEDDQDDVYIFKMAIDAINYAIAVRHAEDGEQLFRLLREQLPDMLFLDINMPCKDGVACIQEIRKERRYDTLPVVMYTVSRYERTVEDCYVAGANYYMLKTGSFEDLVARLKYLFSVDWKTYMHYPTRDRFMLVG